MYWKSRTFKTLAVLVGGGVLFSWLLNHFDVVGGFFSAVWGLLFPFVLGYIVAFLLNLPMNFIETQLLGRWHSRAKRIVSFLLALVLVLGVIVLVVGLVVPQLWSTAMTLSASMPGYIRNLERTLEPYYEYIPLVQEWVQGLDVDWSALTREVSAYLSNGAGNLFSSLINVATSIGSGLFSFVIGLIFACYLLLDKEHLTAQLKGLLQAYLPQKRYRRVSEVSRLVYRSYANFVSGQCVEALLLTLIYLLILSIGGFQYALLIAVVVGFTSLIPLVGAYLGCFVGVFLLLVSMGFGRALVFVIIMIVVQQIEGNFIYPHVIGSSLGLPPVWMLVAVTVGGGLAGIFGMMFFIPLFSVLYTLLHQDAKHRLAKKGIPSPVSRLPETRRQKRRRVAAEAAARADAAGSDTACTDEAAADAAVGPTATPPPDKSDTDNQ